MTNGYFNIKTYVHSRQYLAEFFIESEIFHTRVAEKSETHILCPLTLYREKNRAIYVITWKHMVDPNRPHNNTAQAHSMLDTYGYRHTLRIRNTYCLSTATIVTRTRLNFTSYVHCLVKIQCDYTDEEWRYFAEMGASSDPKHQER